MSYTFLSAAYANEDGSAIVAQTAESGAVAVSRVDRPELWAKLMASGIEIAPFEHVPSAPVQRTERQSGGPEIIAETFMVKDGPGLKAVPFRKGSLRGTVYDFSEIGTELPAHIHDASTVHVSVVCQGRVVTRCNGVPLELSAGDVVAFKPGQEHDFIALEPMSRVVNIVYGK